MPNPYHDETGRFCSKEEMGAAVARLETAVAVAGDASGLDAHARYKETLDTYFTLRRDYESANRAVVEMPEEWVASIAASGLQSMPETTDGIEAFYRSGLEHELRKPNAFHVSKALAIFTHPATPGWIKDDIYRNASVEIKGAMIEELSREYFGNKYPDITSEDLLPFTWGDNGHRNGVTQALLESPRLGFDTKYELAKERGNLGYLLALDPATEAERYGRVPGIEADLRREAGSPLRPAENRAVANNVLARNTQDAVLRGQLLARDETVTLGKNSALKNLLQNRHLSAQERVELLTIAANQDSLNFERAYDAQIDAREAAGEEVSDAHQWRQIAPTSTKAYAGVSPQQEAVTLAELDTYSYLLDNAADANPSIPRDSQEIATKALGEDGAAKYWQQLATLDAQPGRYEGLRRDVKRLEKEIARAYKQRDRKLHDDLVEESNGVHARLNRAKRLRVAQLIVGQLQAELPAENVARA